MKHAALSLACLGLLAPMLSATSIEFVGIESGDAVQNWSNTAEPKTYDLNGDDRFGGAGYYQIMPATIGGETETDNIGLVAGPANDLGIKADISTTPAGSLQTVAVKPDFLNGNPTGSAGDFINNTNFPNFSDSTGVSQLRQGSLWLNNPLNQGTMPGGITGYSNTAFSFTLSMAAGFRIGVAVDTMAFSNAAPDYVSIWNVNTGDVFPTSQLARDEQADMVFFDINGDADDVFVVKLWQADFNRTAFGLITFDQLPVFANPTLTCTQVDGNIILSWEQNIPGWILESSTDLGVADTWETVPGVINNSVSVSMTGVPKNFFRLKKNS